MDIYLIGGDEMKIFLGSSKEDVRSVLGEPSKIDAKFWTYRTSHIQFDWQDKVIAWKNMFHELDEGLEPYRPSDKCFFLGSSKEQVFKALGPPTAIIDSKANEWRYESSHVKFDTDNLVIEWKNLYNQLSHGLKRPQVGSGYIHLGSDKERVYLILGAPDMISALEPDKWYYQASHVKFNNNKVIEWKNQYKQLDKGMKAAEASKQFLRQWLDESSVLEILGSPTTLLASNSNKWRYGASHILFEDHHVVEWQNMFGELTPGCLLPSYQGKIKIGLDKEQVLKIFGSPDRINKLDPETWHYKSSHIKFIDGLVAEWRNMFHDFDRGMYLGDHSEKDIFHGADEDQVLRRLGSPTSILSGQPLTWHYGNAAVYFDDDKKVVSWKNIHDIKKVIELFG